MKYNVYLLEVYQDDGPDIPLEDNRFWLGEIETDGTEESIMAALDKFRFEAENGCSTPLLPEGSEFTIIDLYGTGHWLEVYADGDANCPVCSLCAEDD